MNIVRSKELIGGLTSGADGCGSLLYSNRIDNHRGRILIDKIEEDRNGRIMETKQGPVRAVSK